MAAPHPKPSTARTAAPKTQPLLALLALLACCTLAPATQAAAPQRSSFDHLTTGFELLGQHRDLPCESCHVNAIFKGTPQNCSACHGVGTTVRATAKPTNHMMSTDQCGSCHTEVAWNPAVTFDHKQALGSCSSCHNGVQAQGKPPNHIVTDLECDACHTTISWAGATFTHMGVTGNCAECHNNVSAQGMPANHMPIGSPATPCEACHSNTNFTNWLGAKINHPAVSSMLCASCHETANYLGMHPSTNTTAGDSRPNATLDKNHPAQGDCGRCHDTVSFGGSRASSPPITSRPAHRAFSATRRPAPMPSTRWSASIGGDQLPELPRSERRALHQRHYRHYTGEPYSDRQPRLQRLGLSHHGQLQPGRLQNRCGERRQPYDSDAQHRRSPDCVERGRRLQHLPRDCALHRDDAEQRECLGGLATDGLRRQAPPPPADCGACHTTTPTFANNQLSTALPTGHIPIAPPTYAAQPACATCHTTAGDFTHYSVSAVHQGVNGCIACHGSTVNTTFLNVTPLTTPGNHIPIGTLDCNASGCHSANGGAAGGFKLGTANINAPTLNVARPYHRGHGGSQLPDLSPDRHLPRHGPGHESTARRLAPTRDARCGPSDQRRLQRLPYDDARLSARDMTSGSKPANHIPTTAPCAQCHTTPNNYALYSVTGTHQGVTSCLSCHGPTVAATWRTSRS